MLPFRYQLSQSVKQYFCEVDLVGNSFKIKGPSSRILYIYFVRGPKNDRNFVWCFL